MLGVAAAPIATEIGAQVGAACLAAGRDAVFVGSTDLTHYGPNYGFVPKGTGEEAVRWVREEIDSGFIACVLAGDPAALLAHAVREQSACCPGAVAATLAALCAYGHAPAPSLLTHYLSYDVRPSSSFVGYASIAL